MIDQIRGIRMAEMQAIGERRGFCAEPLHERISVARG